MMRLGLVCLTVLSLSACGAETEEQSRATTQTTSDSLTVTGDFKTPESVLYYEAGDVYFVSNINGAPAEKDDNGFISRVSPEGTIQNLRWIDGAAEAVTLNAPKGMAVIGDTLFVTDIDSVRAFSITTGAAAGARGIPGVTFLNDVAASGGTLYVTDSGLNADFSASGTDAVYKFENGKPIAMVKGSFLGHPNGILVGSDGVIVVPFGSRTVFRINAGATTAEPLLDMPAAQLDGVERLADGHLLVSSWESKTVYRVDLANKQAQAVVTNIESPADIGYDTKRKRVLIPMFNQNRVEIRGIN
jgi:hypothetical protein